MSDEVVVKYNLVPEQQREAVESAAKEVCQSMFRGRTNKCGENIRKEIWPMLRSFKWDLKPVLDLYPLDRVGGEPGKSGNTVLTGLFSATAKVRSGQVVPSRQLVIKISPDFDKDAQLARSKRKEIIQEYEAAVYMRRCFANREHFARPLWLCDLGENRPVVLWAPFESPESSYVVDETGKGKPADVVQAVKYLGASWAETSFQENSTEREQKLKAMVSALGYLRSAHSARTATFRMQTNVVDHYSRELRGFLDPSKNWWKKWRDLWTGNNISDFGRPDWTNPMIVFQKLRDSGSHSLRMGYVHGDLHPRNIVFAGDNAARIIDFGWARPIKKGDTLQHIVKDFVLLEANLRFITLPPFLQYDSVKLLLGWIGMCAHPPRKEVDNECRLRIELIQGLREIARKHIGLCGNWGIEYIAPLFLMSLGLLKHCHSSDCTWAARYNVLRLAHYLNRNVL